MNRTLVSKRMLLAGASAFAMLAGAGAAHSMSWDLPGVYTFTATTSGAYAVEAIGATGGGRVSGEVFQGGRGVEITGDLMLTAGASVDIFVGGPGVNGNYAGGGGGLTAILPVSGGAFHVIAGGGGGASLDANGFPAQGGSSGGSGGGTYGGAGGVAGTGGGGGTMDFASGGFAAAGGGSGLLGAGGNGVGTSPGQGGVGFAGGTGAANGGFGGGGGASQYAGGGGGGFSGGGGGAPFVVGGGLVVFGSGGGGGSFASGLTGGAIVLSGGTFNDAGFVSINEISAAVPEPSTWAMMLTGFSALGAMLMRRTGKTKPA